MTNTELIELLRKTRGWVGHNLDCTNVCDECALAARIDAALAAQEVEELVEDVKWRQEADYDGSVVYVARLKSKSLRVFYRYDKTFDWTASVVWSKEGKSRTLDEAQRAALSAAMGLK